MHWLKAIPELISAGILLALWMEPARFGIEWFKSGVLALLLEFFVIHASGFMAVLMFDPEMSRAKRSALIMALSSFYILMMSAFAWGFDAWWMLYAFLWLIASKQVAIWHGGPPTERDRGIAIAAWALSVAVYLGSVAATAILDVPRLGVTDEVRASTGFTGEGLWEAEPWRALAGAVLYFTLMAFSRPMFARAQARAMAARDAA
jgi:hypothetical protein